MTAPEDPTPAEAPTHAEALTPAEARRELLVALGLCLLGSAVVLWGASLAWVTFPVEHGLPFATRAFRATGAELVPGLRALGVAGLASAVAVLATRGRGRAVVGWVVVVGGLTVVLLAVPWAWQAPLRTRAVRWFGAHYRECSGSCSVDVRNLTQLSPSTGAVLLALAGGLVLVLGGLLVALRGRRWAGLGSSYDAPGGAAEPPVTDKAVWEALDRGDDPTA